MAQLPTRQHIDRAEPLHFPQRRPKADLTITVKATIDGFCTEVCFTGSIDQLLNVTKRLRDLGAAPTIAPAHTATLGNGKRKAQRAEPLYQPDGAACCPIHKKPRSVGRYGLSCPSKAKPGEEQHAKGYGSLRFESCYPVPAGCIRQCRRLVSVHRAGQSRVQAMFRHS
jgi:hypothetical protein